MTQHRPVALVTGASRGIGRGIALSLAGAGYDIAGTATSLSSGLEEVMRQAEGLGAKFIGISGDVSNLDEHERMVLEAQSISGRIDCFVSNAGVAPSVRADMLDMQPESYDRVMGINARGSFFLAQRVANAMLAQPQQPHAHHPAPGMIFITSVSASTASINRAEYCMSKAALSMAAQCLAVRMAPHGVNVYEIQPGIIATDMTTAVREKYDALIAEGLLLSPRWGTPEDIGKAVVSLARGDFAYATGAVIEIGGGMGVRRL
jgi:3-oxoacyl-[acyl-carrier protein] reductase